MSAIYICLEFSFRCMTESESFFFLQAGTAMFGDSLGDKVLPTQLLRTKLDRICSPYVHLLAIWSVSAESVHIRAENFVFIAMRI